MPRKCLLQKALVLALENTQENALGLALQRGFSKCVEQSDRAHFTFCKRCTACRQTPQFQAPPFCMTGLSLHNWDGRLAFMATSNTKLLECVRLAFLGKSGAAELPDIIAHTLHITLPFATAATLCGGLRGVATFRAKLQFSK